LINYWLIDILNACKFHMRYHTLSKTWLTRQTISVNLNRVLDIRNVLILFDERHTLESVVGRLQSVYLTIYKLRFDVTILTRWRCSRNLNAWPEIFASNVVTSVVKFIDYDFIVLFIFVFELPKLLIMGIFHAIGCWLLCSC
jgi:hypothetical protein